MGHDVNFLKIGALVLALCELKHDKAMMPTWNVHREP